MAEINKHSNVGVLALMPNENRGTVIHALKHMAIRLWLTLLVGSFLALAGLPAIQALLGLEWTFAIAAPVFVALFYVIGWLFNRFGLNLVRRHINEATVWERAGKTSQAERLFRKAVAVFDSFLISPFNKEKRAQTLTGHMARFYLTQADLSPEAENVILAYLKIRPQDQAVAEAWLQRIENRNQDPGAYEELLFLLGKTQSDNPTIQTLIARRYLSTGRTDFQALQTYRRFMQNQEGLDKHMISRMADLFFEKRRMEPWALKAYLIAYKLDKKKTRLIHGIAACLHETQANHGNSATFKEARLLLSRIDKTSLMKMIAEFKAAGLPSDKPEPASKARSVQPLTTAARSIARTLTTGIASTLTVSAGAFTAAYRRIRAYPMLRPLLRWTAVGLAVGGLLLLAVNTVTYLIQTRSEPEKMETAPVGVVTDPYTLQVAAYLNTEHAQKYVAQLKSLDLDAYWTEAQGSKRKWYQVRLSHFADKASARAYGDALKAKGIIDDYYVANYQRP